MINILHTHLLHFVDLVSDWNDTFLDKDDFAKLIELVIEDGVTFGLDGFQIGENINHEVTINRVVPRVKQSIFPSGAEENIPTLVKSEKGAEILEEWVEQEAAIQFVLDPYRKLKQNILLLFVIDGLIKVVIPFVLKEFLDIFFHLQIYLLPVVEFYKESEKASKFVPLVKVGMTVSKLI